MYITAYSAIIEPLLGRLPIYECIESLYDHVDAFVFVDCSKYDSVDLSKYGKVKKHVKSIFHPFDNPFGSAFSQALRLVESDTSMFLDIDEIFSFKSTNLKDIVNRYPLDQNPDAGVAFSLRNYYCSRNFVIDGCSSKGPHVFRTNHNLSHDALNGYWKHRNRIRRTNDKPDSVDGVRICTEQCMPTSHFQPVGMEEVIIHHTSHLDLAGKLVRSIFQYNHTSTLDLLDFFPTSMQVSPDVVNKIYNTYVEDIKKGDIELYGYPELIEYEGNKHLDAFVQRIGLHEFDPTTVPDYKNWIDKKKK